MKQKLLLLLIVGLTACTSSFANNSIDPKTDLGGAVLHSQTHKPLKDVTITAYNASKKEKVVVTDSDGNFSFDSLRPGTYRFVFEKDGYKKVSKEKVITRPDEGYDLQVLMEEHGHFEFVPGLLFDF